MGAGSVSGARGVRCDHPGRVQSPHVVPSAGSVTQGVCPKIRLQGPTPRRPCIVWGRTTCG